jgi:Ser/Thr protein kinase RdoA (MazF antagonist)
MVMIPASAWGWREEQVSPLGGGLINATYVVRANDAPIAVLQRMHPVFGADVNCDLDAVTTHIAAHGMETPRLIRTLDGAAWFEQEGVWRATTWVDGESVATVPDASWAEAGGELVGRFHVAVDDLDYAYKFTRTGVHDTARHLATLRDHCDASRVDEWRDLAHQILALTIELPALEPQPLRNVHGDLKISNLLFRRDPVRGAALVDLDTLARGSLAFELGDAMRSWCNPHGEDAGHVKLELPIFTAAITGYRRVADHIVSEAERASVAVGLETVCVELASRFCTDVFEDRYFGWDPKRFESRRAHNVVRARGQLALAYQVRSAREQLREILLG